MVVVVLAFELLVKLYGAVVFGEMVVLALPRLVYLKLGEKAETSRL